MSDPITLGAKVVGSLAAAKSAFDPESGQTTQTRDLDPAQLAMLREVYGAGRTLANQPFVPFTGARVAGFNPDQLRQFQATRGLFETGMQYDPLSGIAGLAGSETPQIGQVPSLLQTDIGAYQSPFTQQVIDTSLSDLDRARQMAVGRDQDRAISAGAFGGSRSGVLEAETNRAFAEQAARTAANLRQQGFRQALGAAESDIARQQARAFAQPELELRSRAQRAGLLGGLQAEQARRLGLLSGIGRQQQGLQQRSLDVPFQEFQRALGFGPQQLGLLSAAAGSPFFTGGSSQYQPTTLEGVTTALDILGSDIFQT